MRKNLPVTNQEFILEASCAIISHTDAKGVITYVNDEFVQTSGFTREELIGKAHNVVRHPDMPEEAFADLWATLKRGRPWRGMVKNRRKNGDYYWVMAQVTPRAEGGYISVRIRPSREEVEKAEALYAQMRRGQAGKRLVEGELVATGLGAAVFRRVFHMSVSAKLGVLSLLTALGVGMVSLIGAYQTYGALMQEKHAGTRRMVDSAHGLVMAWKARAERKEIGEEQAKAGAADALRALRNSQGDYFWIQDMARPVPRMVMHPTAPKLEGAVLDAAKYDTADGRQAAGTPGMQALERPANLFVVAADLARESGGGFLSYQWPKPAAQGVASSENFPKVSYVKKVADWNWVIGTGVYVDDVRQQTIQAAIKSGSAALGVAVLILAVALWLRHQIIHALRQASAMADTIGRGDLVADIPKVEDGELGELIVRLRIMRNSLHEVAASLRQNSGALHGLADGISHESGEGAKNSAAQSDAVGSIAAAVEQLSVSIDQVDEHARTAMTVNQAANEQSQEGADVIHAAIAEINDIASTVNGAAGSIRELEGYTDQISSVVGTIHSIAEQTNLLALNAAIEAARAGEEGRGFAVVADEVRKLAESTASSTAVIKSMVEKVVQATRSSSREMGKSVERAGRGVEMASRAQVSIGAIRDGMAQAKEAVDGITVSLSEQSIAAREMAARVETLAQGTEEHALAANRTADDAKRMSVLATDMDKLSARFKIS